MNVLVIGGNGFLGQELCNQLVLDNLNLDIASRSPKKEGVYLDLTDYSSFSNLKLNFFDVVINCASVLTTHADNEDDYLNNVYRTNIIGSIHICKWISTQSSIRTIINCSTLAVIPKPWPINLSENVAPFPVGIHQVYTSSKIAQESIFSQTGIKENIDVCHVRFSSLYGIGMNKHELISRLFANAKKQNKIELTNGNNVFADFLHITDAAKILRAIVRNPITGIVNGATGVETSLVQLASNIVEHLTEEIEIINTDDHDTGSQSRALISISKLNRTIDTTNFTTVSNGIKSMIEQ